MRGALWDGLGRFVSVCVTLCQRGAAAGTLVRRAMIQRQLLTDSEWNMPALRMLC